VAVVCASCREAVPEVFTHIEADPGSLLEDLRAFASSAVIRNRRRAHRFDWPLQGFLSTDGRHWETLRVRSLSRDGAFLESEGASLQAGARGRLRVVFQDFRLETTCEVLDGRLASSRLPAGFGVRFLGLSEASRGQVDRIVNDALVRSLLSPDDSQGAPSLGAESLSLGPELR
jgi:hypothetical protein